MSDGRVVNVLLALPDGTVLRASTNTGDFLSDLARAHKSAARVELARPATEAGKRAQVLDAYSQISRWEVADTLRLDPRRLMLPRAEDIQQRAQPFRDVFIAVAVTDIGCVDTFSRISSSDATPEGTTSEVWRPHTRTTRSAQTVASKLWDLPRWVPPWN